LRYIFDYCLLVSIVPSKYVPNVIGFPCFPRYKEQEIVISDPTQCSVQKEEGCHPATAWSAIQRGDRGPQAQDLQDAVVAVFNVVEGTGFVKDTGWSLFDPGCDETAKGFRIRLERCRRGQELLEGTRRILYRPKGIPQGVDDPQETKRDPCRPSRARTAGAASQKAPGQDQQAAAKTHASPPLHSRSRETIPGLPEPNGTEHPRLDFHGAGRFRRGPGGLQRTAVATTTTTTAATTTLASSHQERGTSHKTNSQKSRDNLGIRNYVDGTTTDDESSQPAPPSYHFRVVKRR
jgi:hypothetical protein